MGNIVQVLKDPQLVRSFQEMLGVRQISVEVSEKGYAGAETSSEGNSSAEDSSEEGHAQPPSHSAGAVTELSAETTTDRESSDSTQKQQQQQATKNGIKKGSLSWIKSKARIRRRIRTPSPPPSPDPSSTSDPAATTSEVDVPTQVLVVETNPFLDAYFRLATELGYEPFYITFLPFISWNVDTVLMRYVVITWCISMYVGQGAKQIFKIRRPKSPPAIRLEDNPSLETEYGFPSTHATVGTTVPFCLLFCVASRYQVSKAYFVCRSMEGSTAD